MNIKKQTKGVNINVVATISHNEYKDFLLNNKCLRHSISNGYDGLALVYQS